MFWFEEDIKCLETQIKEFYEHPYTLFLGSGTFTHWHTINHDFLPNKVLNLSYGGATIASTCWFFDRIVDPDNLSSIVMYLGENDLGENRHPEEICMLSHYFIERVREFNKEIPIIFLAIKPSPTRWGIIDRIYYTNEIMKMMLQYNNNCHYLDVYSPMLDKYGHPNPVFFKDDGLHLSYDGEQLWKKMLLESENLIFNQSNKVNYL